MRKADHKRIEVSGLWVNRCILRVSWLEQRTNASEHNVSRIKELFEECFLFSQELQINDNRLIKQVNSVYLSYFKHVARRPQRMDTLIEEGKIVLKRPRGRQPMRWVEKCKEITGHSLYEVMKLVQGR